MLKQFSILVLLILFLGCSPKAITLSDYPRCKSTVEGFYHYRSRWNGKFPVLFKKKDRKIIPVYGKILEQKEDGFLFDPKRQGPLYDPEPEFFPNEKIVAVIDSSNKIIFGELPEKYKRTWELFLFVKNMDVKGSEIKVLELKPNKRFGFCLVPGNYHIKKIRFKNNEGLIDEALDLPNLYFSVESNSVNYIGDIYLDFYDKKNNVIYLPYKNVYNPSEVAIAGVMGGAIGGALYVAFKAAKGAEGIHVMTIEDDASFSSFIKLPKKTNMITVK
ncbi:MAG: hypothetical protein GXO77_17420 [Calditrichaeota bacterium]|nr:hypothetical protein [Calditrichota bacterium]